MEKNALLDTLDKSIIREARTKITICAAIVLRVLCFTVLFFFITSCSLPRIVILEDPLSPEEHLNLGVTYEMNGEFGNALDEYKKASKTIPHAYTYIGNIFFKKGEVKDAEIYYKKAIEEDPYPADACNNLAWLYYKEKKNLDEAENLALKAIQLNPSKQDVYQDTLEKIKRLKAATL